MLKLIFLFNFLILIYSIKWSLQSIYSDKSGDSITLIDNGLIYLATSDSYNNEINLYLNYYFNNITTFGKIFQIKKNNQNNNNLNGFGKIINFINIENIEKKYLFIGEINENGDGKTYM